jgi:protein-tyrosine phosphatase
MERIHNFRDFGGLRTESGEEIKKGLLFRSASLARATDGDLEELSSLRIRTVCDLRTNLERRRRPDRLPGGSSLMVVHIPIRVSQHDESGLVRQLCSLLFGRARRLEYGEVVKQAYQEYVTEFRTQISDILRLVCDQGNLPILIHCTGGKDRTGIICAIIQTLLGVSPASVMQDYLLSNDNLHAFRTAILDRLRILSVFGVANDKFIPLLEARREYLDASFSLIEHDYGSMKEYVRSGLGFLDSDVHAMKRLLLDRGDRSILQSAG